MQVSQVNFSLTPELSEKIRTLACEGLNSLRAGAEIGGIITALSSPASPEYDVRLVRCEHKLGPFWRLSDQELSKLEQTVRQTLSEGKIVVAYFRSCTRPSMNIEPADRDNIEVACRSVPFIVLTKPSRSGTSQINVFGRGPKGEWELTQSVSARPPFEPVAMPVGHENENNDRALLAPNRGIPRASRNFLAIAAAMLIITAAVLWFNGRSPNHSVVATSGDATPINVTPVNVTPAGTAAPSPTPKLGLVVTEENGKLHATWNHDSLAARSAIFGSLLIRDSERAQEIELSRADVTGGSIVYTPRSADVTIRLLLTNSAIETSTEMIRFIGGGSHPVESRTPVRVPDAQVSSTVPHGVSVAPPPVTVSAVTPQPVAPPPVAPSPVAASAPAAGADRKTPVIVVQPALELARASTAPDLVPVPIPPPAPVGNKPAPGAPLTGSPAPPPVPQATVPPTQGIASTPPVPLRTSQPTKEDRASWKLYSPVTVPITVSVDARGRVIKAFPSVKPDPRINPFLVQLCVNAAMEWVFKPATREGRPVAAEFGIEFRFKPDSER